MADAVDSYHFRDGAAAQPQRQERLVRDHIADAPSIASTVGPEPGAALHASSVLNGGPSLRKACVPQTVSDSLHHLGGKRKRIPHFADCQPGIVLDQLLEGLMGLVGTPSVN